MIKICRALMLFLTSMLATVSTFTDSVRAETRAYTFSVNDSLQMPGQVQSEIRQQYKMRVSLPTSFKLDTPLPRNVRLAIELDVSPSYYGMNLFDRPKGSNTSKYAMSSLIGDMETVSSLRSFAIPHRFDVHRFTSQNTMKLVDDISATHYLNSRGHDSAIIWGAHGWKYIAEGVGSAYENQAPGMANTIAGFVSKHGFLVMHAKQGYVQAVWAGNRPEFRVMWTYDDRQWYTLSMDTLTETLGTALTVTVS